MTKHKQTSLEKRLNAIEKDMALILSLLAHQVEAQLPDAENPETIEKMEEVIKDFDNRCLQLIEEGRKREMN